MSREVDLESELNQVIKKFGLDYIVVISPRSRSSGRLGRVDLNRRIIYIYTDDSDLAYRVLFHEILEIMFKPLIDKYIDLINLLIKYIEDNLYLEKERIINDLLKILFKRS